MILISHLILISLYNKFRFDFTFRFRFRFLLYALTNIEEQARLFLASLPLSFIVPFFLLPRTYEPLEPLTTILIGYCNRP